MSTLKWDRPKDRTFEAGLDRGVLYLETGKAIAWSGLTNVTDSGKSEIKELYLDGQKYLTSISARDWEGTLEALTYPDEFGELLGILELGDGLYADSQMPGRFGLSYRTMVSTPNLDTEQYYKIHLVYKVMASMSDLSYSTLSSDSLDPVPFQFDLSAVPQRIPNARPTAHVILDTRKMDDTTRVNLEGILYGKFGSEPRMPSITELVDLLSYGDGVVIVENFYVSPETLPPGINPSTGVEYAYGDSKGTWTATGSNTNVYMIPNPFDPDDPNVDTFFQIDNSSAHFITSEIYEFFDGGVGFSLFTDTDGIPYYGSGLGDSNVGIDTDGVPFYADGQDAATINEDTDGTPYFGS